PQFYAFAVLTFRGDANGNVAPVRKIFGPHTQMKNPEALALDWIHGEIFVPQGDHVLVFPRDGNGDMAPIRILGGPDNPVNAGRLTVDPVPDLLIGSSNDGIRIYRRTASGMDKPLRTITSRGARGAFLLTTNPPSGMIFATVQSSGDQA